MVKSDNTMVFWDFRVFFRNSENDLRRESLQNYNLDLQKRDLGGEKMAAKWVRTELTCSCTQLGHLADLQKNKMNSQKNLS